MSLPMKGSDTQRMDTLEVIARPQFDKDDLAWR
jgi:hypothetical protein